jgi:sec-independent protein translocase protein TatA
MGLFFQGDELLILFIILILILGPSKIPQLARGLGQAVREFRKASQGFYDELESTMTSRTSRPIYQVSRSLERSEEKRQENSVDPELIRKLAEKLGVSTEGKSQEELAKEVIAKAKEKGLLN